MTLNKGLKEYNEKLRLGLVTKPKTLNPIEKAKQNPNSLRFAINARCYNCSGFTKVDVTYCDMPDCELFNLRPWQKANIKTTINGVDTVLSEKPTMIKYGCSGRKIPQERLNSKGELLPPYAKLRANPKSLRAAINAYCFWCCCEQYKEVRLCPSVKCPLHYLRPWQPKHNTSKNINRHE